MNGPDVSKAYLEYCIALHKSLIESIHTPDIIEEHKRIIKRLEERIQKEFPLSAHDKFMADEDNRKRYEAKKETLEKEYEDAKAARKND